MLKKFSVLFALIILTLSINAQDKDFQKIENLYSSAQYEKCIEKAKKVSQQYPKESIPLYYTAFSNFQIYKTATELRKKMYLNNTLNSLKFGLVQDDTKENFSQFPELTTEIHDTILAFAQRLWDNDKDASGFYFKALAQIYNDTTTEYMDLFVPKVAVFQQDLAFNETQGPTNQTDAAGNRQGIWVKKSPDGMVESEIFFKDNHPAGSYRKYYPNGHLKAKMYFDTKGIVASAILYNDDGTKAAMGYYKNKQKDSLWQYYYNDTLVISEETYSKGIKNGRETIYSLYSYPNPLDEKFWKDGQMDSLWTRYYMNGTPKFIATYKNGIRQGKYVAFNETGQTIVSGVYIDNLPEGVWNYWDETEAKFIKIKYIKGVPENADQLSQHETEIIKQIEDMKGKIEEPIDQIQSQYGGGDY